MPNKVLHAMMNSGNPLTRKQARLLSRGRIRGLDPALEQAIKVTDRVIRDTRRLQKDGAGAATGADTGFTPTFNSVPNARKRVLQSLPTRTIPR